MITLNFKCSYNGVTLEECKKDYKFSTFEDFAEQWKNCNGKGWTVSVEGYKVTATNAAGKIYEYSLEFDRHFFTVLWETKTSTGATREYTKEFATEEGAVKFARAKRENPKTSHVEISEEETKDTPECIYIRIIRMHIKF